MTQKTPPPTTSGGPAEVAGGVLLSALRHPGHLGPVPMVGNSARDHRRSHPGEVHQHVPRGQPAQQLTMRRSRKKAFTIIIGLMLFYIPVELIGDVVERSDLPAWIAHSIYFLLGALTVVVVWIAVKRLD